MKSVLIREICGPLLSQTAICAANPFVFFRVISWPTLFAAGKKKAPIRGLYIIS